MITIAVQCHHFQRRFCWMLSSLAQQTRRDMLTVSVAYVSGNGKPSTKEVCAQFYRKLNIVEQVYEGTEKFQYRGLVRNRQLEECKTDWLMFGDCDMVYSPDYFERLIEHLLIEEPCAPYMLSSGRISNPKELTNKLVDREVLDRAREVEHAFALADELPKKEMRNCGAGFCQLFHMKHCPHGGYYVKPEENRDTNWDRRGSNPRSDMQFRRRISANGNHRRNLPEWFTDNAIHLNHDRDPDVGQHLTHQR